MANQFNEKYERRRSSQVGGLRAGLDYLMGAAFIIIGSIILYKYRPDVSMVAFGILAVLYGAWRIYKGYKKNYRF